MTNTTSLSGVHFSDLLCLAVMVAEPDETTRNLPLRRQPRPSDWWPRPPLQLPPCRPPRNWRRSPVNLQAPGVRVS